MNKLPQELRLIISRKIGEDDWKLDKLMSLLQEEVQARERAMVNTPVPPKHTSKGSKTAATLLTKGTDTNPTCCYCNQSHYSDKCRVVESITERKRILREKGRCYMCLRRGHLSRQCSSKMRCYNCHGRHHSSIYEARSTMQTEQGGQVPAETTISTQQLGMNPTAPAFKPPTSTALWTSSSQAILLQRAQAVISNPGNPHCSKRARIVFDGGSQRSYITERLKSELSVESIGEQTMQIATFGAKGGGSCKCEIVNVCIELKNGYTKQFALLAVPFICQPLACQPVSFCQDQFAHLKGLHLADDSNGQGPLSIDILIGSDQYWSLVTGETRRGEQGPVGVHTELGWVLSKPACLLTQGQTQTTLVAHVSDVDNAECSSMELENCLRAFWTLESLGIVDQEHPVFEEFKDFISFADGRYEVSLPWKDTYQLLPDNYQLSLRRLYRLLRRLRQDQKLFIEYNSVIKSQLRNGIVEFVDSMHEPAHPVHYLPHHAIVRRDKDTTKLRVIYDASARSTGLSLNDCLHAGPKFDQRIFDLLLRFRIHRVALVADIEKAFLMVGVSRRDRDVLRFLWVDDITKNEPEVLELRFARVVFGVSSSPFLLNATIRHHLNSYSSVQPDLVDKLQRSFYVDDVSHWGQ